MAGPEDAYDVLAALAQANIIGRRGPRPWCRFRLEGLTFPGFKEPPCSQASVMVSPQLSHPQAAMSHTPLKAHIDTA